MTLSSLTEAVRARVAAGGTLGARVKFDLGPDGAILLDATGPAPLAVDGDGPADTTLSMTAEVLGRLLDGTLDPSHAYMTGKLKVQGSLTVAMKLGSLLSD